MLDWRIREYEEVTSTQVVADELARGGAPAGTVVVARGQTAGVGRFGRRWLSPRGGLYMSLVLRPDRVEGVHLLPLVGALAVVEGVEQGSRVSPQIRWPNDVVIRGKKFGGVIANATMVGESLERVVVGIGVNCNSSAEGLGELAGTSITLKDLLGMSIDLDSLRSGILGRFGAHYQRWEVGGEKELVKLIRPILSTTGREVEYKRVGGGVERGFAKRMEDDGSILVTKGGGGTRLRAEEIEWLRER